MRRLEGEEGPGVTAHRANLKAARQRYVAALNRLVLRERGFIGAAAGRGLADLRPVAQSRA